MCAFLTSIQTGCGDINRRNFSTRHRRWQDNEAMYVLVFAHERLGFRWLATIPIRPARVGAERQSRRIYGYERDKASEIDGGRSDG